MLAYLVQNVLLYLCSGLRSFFLFFFCKWILIYQVHLFSEPGRPVRVDLVPCCYEIQHFCCESFIS